MYEMDTNRRMTIGDLLRLIDIASSVAP